MRNRSGYAALCGINNVMRFHDYHLREYTVHDYGARIVMVLAWEYPDDPRPLSVIEFTGVECYRFSHSGGAIITEIDEMTWEAVASDEQDYLANVARMDGLRHWDGSFTNFVAKLQANKVRPFRIDSAVGFTGFVLAANVNELSHNQSTDPAFSSGAPAAGQPARHP
jgi:hypothetical protein